MNNKRLKEALSIIEEEFTTIHTQNEKLTKRICKLENELSNVKSNLQKQIDSMKTDISTIEDQT